MIKKFWKWLADKGFANWFKGSKIVDENGEPKMVYHGTPISSKINKFKISTGGTISFSFNPTFAGSFGRKGGSQSNIVVAYLKVINPFDYRKQEHKEILQKYWQNLKMPYIKTMMEELNKGLFAVIADPKFLKSNGFDGCYTTEGNTLNIEVLDPNQIWIVDQKEFDSAEWKSKIGNEMPFYK